VRADKKHVIVILNGEGDDELVGRYNQPLMIRDAERRSGTGSGDADT
jgi:asparagine synthetase B (glutamine-hydrolysing)